MSEHRNRLADEKSPYLRQHAGNPVDWYPWGDEAFAKARAEDKPVFLSIGYSTCHWCHVMERETFEDPEAARLMNEAFVCVKVDREERPDLDSVYMTACMMMTGRGGWPLTIIMSPDKRPFFAATYIPKETRAGMTGMLDLAPSIKDIWATRREEVLEAAERVTGAMIKLSPRSGDLPDAKSLAGAYAQLTEIYDQAKGGFGKSPKFPSPHSLLFLMRMHLRTGEALALAMVTSTLKAMRRGGIFDHLGLGFHRYSTDEKWLLPHFEKMLYDQAGLALVCGEAYQISGDDFFLRLAGEIHEYVYNDLRHPDGAYFCAEDADSEGQEGRFYLWTMAEIREALGPEDAKLAAAIFGLEEEGNFKDEATGEKTGANVLHLPRPLEYAATNLGLPKDELRAAAERIRRRLLSARSERVRPMRDDKVLADWNGYYIAALAANARAFGRADLTFRARLAADFVLERMLRTDGRLYHRFKDGSAGIDAFLDDYAFMIWGLVELYQACLEPKYLKAAVDLAGSLIAGFSDSEHGGFFLAPKNGDKLLYRPKESSDGAMPTGNSVAALALAKLAHLTGRTEFEDMARRAVRAFSVDMARGPANYCMLLCALDFVLGPTAEIAIAGERSAEDTRKLIEAVNLSFLPRAVLLLACDDIADLAAFTRYMRPDEGKARAFGCENFTCHEPVASAGEMLKLLGVSKTRE